MYEKRFSNRKINAQERDAKKNLSKERDVHKKYTEHIF